jgi:secreted trypsin-like serine protease
MRRIAIVLAAGLAVIAGSGSPAFAIARGADAADGRYPFSAKLEMTGIPTLDGSTRDSSCSGSLIAPHWIITAGHCFKDARDRHVSRPVAKKTVAIVGRADLSGSGGDEATVVEVHQSPTHDIALAKLDRAITDVAPVRIATSPPRTGSEVRLTGFGFTSGEEGSLPSRMQTGEFRVTSISGVSVGMSGIAPHANTSPCEHDSGGPYFTGPDSRPTLVAVVSRGPDCPHTGADTSARVDTAATWIRSLIRTDRVTPPTPKPTQGQPSPTPAAALPPPAAAGTGDHWPMAAGVAGAAAVVLAPLAFRRRRRRPSPVRSHRRR